MKSTSLIFLALTLVKFIDCSEQVPTGKATEMDVEPENGSATLATATAAALAIQNQLFSQIEEFSSSAAPSGYRSAVTSKKRKMTNEIEGEEDDIQSDDDQGHVKSPEESAADVLMSLGGLVPSPGMFDDQRRAPVKAKKIRAPPAPKPRKALIPLDAKTLARPNQKDFSKFFDERNIQTEGVSTLARCIGQGINLNLGSFLIRSGARLDPATSTTALYAAMTEPNQISNSILMELVAAAPLETTRAFLSLEVDCDLLDFFFFSLLDDETSAFFFSSPELPAVIELLIKSGKMPNSLAFIFENLHCPFDKSQIAHFAALALECGNISFIKTILESGALHVEDPIAIDGSGYNVICSLIKMGRFADAFPLMRRFNYNINYTHDQAANPNGDIILFVMQFKPYDLDAFRVLLKLGASLDVFFGKPGNMKSLRSFLTKLPQFTEIVDSFTAGTLTLTPAEEEIIAQADLAYQRATSAAAAVAQKQQASQAAVEEQAVIVEEASQAAVEEQAVIVEEDLSS